ncbi:MAG: sigma-70 family RNA polymerase sigma factor [Gemmatimonadales bacterium]|nr:sigma-70 family RNA polymerase sigma factor [Gemmatimonadales bacterium]
MFGTEFRRLFRYLDRLSGEPDLAADLAQEAFVRLHARGTMPERPEAWLVTVALNLFRNVKTTRARQRRLLTVARAESVLADPAPSPAQTSASADASAKVRVAIDRLPERDRGMLLLLAEGYSYRDIASTLELKEASIGTLLARAKRAFRESYEGDTDAP